VSVSTRFIVVVFIKIGVLEINDAFFLITNLISVGLMIIVN
jgi:hypothetical protein